MQTTTKNTSRHGLRAPKGGCTVNGRYFAGGQFCLPYDESDPHGLNTARPSRLQGSSRQVSWASRLRLQAIARIEAQIKTSRKGVSKLVTARLALLTSTSAVAIINAR